MFIGFEALEIPQKVTYLKCPIINLFGQVTFFLVMQTENDVAATIFSMLKFANLLCSLTELSCFVTFHLLIRVSEFSSCPKLAYLLHYVFYLYLLGMRLDYT